MKHLAVLISMCILCVSCVKKEKKEQINVPLDTKVIKVDLANEYKGVKFPKTNNFMRVLRLEDNDEHPIGQVSKVIADNKKIYLLDKLKANALFVYSQEGLLLHVIDKKGQGPGEFSRPDDFDVEKKTGNIIIMDASQKKFIVYSPKGEFIREFKYDFFASKFSLNQETHILADNGNIPSPDSDFLLKEMDINGNYLKSFFPSDPSTLGMSFETRYPLQQFGDYMFFLPTLSNSIYALKGEESSLAYQIDFGNAWPSKEFCESVQNIHPLKMRESMLEKGYVCFLNFLQTKDVLQLDFHKDKNYSFYYNKETGKSILISMDDDSISLPLGTYDDKFITVKYNENTGAVTVIFYTVNFDLI
ncbi:MULTISPECIES: 6-bladed beta-propeller [unclassified Parabacteroides]|uniref:6-bladed beta-propeller n=1 Tax=unclassified Parabacteroides TaxID=2649774 RepID=UPI002476F0F5|nr:MULTISPECIES: 6-bladed beta-propeller [unclassified Parabacteroides]